MLLLRSFFRHGFCGACGVRLVVVFGGVVGPVPPVGPIVGHGMFMLSLEPGCYIGPSVTANVVVVTSVVGVFGSWLYLWGGLRVG